MTRATDAFDRLTAAMQDTDPACQNDDRFILDGQPAESLSSICRACPLFDLCAIYGELARPTGGIWAGKRYKTNSTTKENA